MADDHPDKVKHRVGKFYAMEKQRDELLQECRLALACLEGMQTEVYDGVERVNEGGTPGIIMKRLRSAIAKAERGGAKHE